MLKINIPIVSVHTPKVAGSSFLHQLRSIFGDSDLLLDYSDDPADHRSRGSLDPDSYCLNPITTIAPYRVVHGHFHPKKYDALGEALRLTFLRHPINNVISIYRFWRAHPPEIWNTPLYRYFKENDLSIQRLAMLPTIRFLYSKTYFGEFDMDCFDFIGDYRDYTHELQRLGSLLEVEFDLGVRLNITQEIADDDPRFNQSDIAALSNILADDISFYERYAGK